MSYLKWVTFTHTTSYKFQVLKFNDYYFTMALSLNVTGTRDSGKHLPDFVGVGISRIRNDEMRDRKLRRSRIQ